MDKQQSKQLVKDTFENSFNKEKFHTLVKNLLNTVEEKTFIYRGNTIPKAFQDSVKTLERIGKYKNEDKKIDILIVQLKKENSLERARSKQRNFISWYLKSRGNTLKDGALIAFVAPSKENWRFSFVKMDYKYDEKKKKVKEDFTPARRYSFLVGKNESSHTAQSCLLDLLQEDNKNPSLEDLESAFSIEKVTKEFFEKYRDLFHKIKEALDEIIKENKKIEKDFESKQINSSDFSKKLLGQIVFLYFLQKKGWFGVKRGEAWGTGSKHFLRELFKWRKDIYKSQGVGSSENFFNDILEPLFYEALGQEHTEDYYSRFDCRIPFLNGGLFEPINSYDWVNTNILLSDNFFSNNKKTKEGDIGDGILDIFDRYNFTVKEDEPLEKEVAVDPEMLGKVFENLLEVKDRKSKGTYYTPREIVHYMCQESLINYLAEELKEKINREDIEILVKHGESAIENESQIINQNKETKRYSFKLSEKIRNQAKLIDKKLMDIRICDPAVGSGAFPVGMMNEIIRVRNALTPFIKTKKERISYHFKRHTIQYCLYGVDIDSGAIEIAKLRLWLSLIVDEDDRNIIKPLPNLDYKMVCGNSLLGVDKDLFNQEQFSQLEKIKPLYFDETNSSKKQKYKEQIDKLINEITNGHKVFDFEIYFSEVFHKKQGFDVIISNPPYIEHKKLKSISNFLKNKFKTYCGTADLYVYFYEISINLLKNNGVLSFISSNKFFKTKYGFNLRGLLAKQKIHNIIDFTKVHIFDALVTSCVVILSKAKVNNSLIVSLIDNTFTGDLPMFISKNHIKISASSLGNDIWYFAPKSQLDIKNKIEKNTKKLGAIPGVKIFRGVTTGYNPAFMIDSRIKNKLIAINLKTEKIIKPLIQGRDIKKWFYITSKNFLLFTKKGINISAYPEIKKYLLQYKNWLEPGKGRKPGLYKWYEIQDNTAYYNEFNKEKIVWGLTANNWAFSYDDKKNFLPSNGYILTSSNIPIKYLLALLNSNLMKFYFSFIGVMTAGGAFTLKNETISKLPIKKSTQEEKLINLVNKILNITKAQDYLTNLTKQNTVREYENQIDRLVYQIYSLTPEEINTIEGA